MGEFLAMGGHGAYIWACYGLAALVMIWLLVASIRTMRSRETMVAALRQNKNNRSAPEAASPANKTQTVEQN